MRLDPPRLHLLGLLLITCVAGGLAVHERTARRAITDLERTRDSLATTLTTARQVSARWRVAWRAEKARALAHADGTTAAIGAYRAVRRAQIVAPRTRADTVTALRQLPATVAACDALRDSAATLAATVQRLTRTGDAVVATDDARDRAADRLIATQDRLVDRYRRGPRLSAVGVALYDPFAHQYAVAVQGSLRVVGDWSLIARGERRFEPGGTLAYVGLAHPLF